MDRPAYTSSYLAVNAENERSFMLRVYNYMCSGLGITGLVAYLVSLDPALMHSMLTGPTVWVVMLSPFILLFAIFAATNLRREVPLLSLLLFYIFAGTFGLSMSVIFAKYAGATIALAFFISASTFAGASIVGYTTGKDMSGWGGMLLSLLIGMIIAMVVNAFMQSQMMQYIISSIVVVLFTVFTAYDTQMIKDRYRAGYGDNCSAVEGALDLYLDFLNIFLNVLRLIGED